MAQRHLRRRTARALPQQSELVDDSWRSYFTELIGGDGNGLTCSDCPGHPCRRAPQAPQRLQTGAAPQPEGEVIPIRGPAEDRREHGAQPLRADSDFRTPHPVKLLDENRRIINKHLAENDRGKASYT